MQNNLPNQQFVREFYSGFYTPLKKKVNTFSNVLNKPFKITKKKLIMRQGYKFKVQYYGETY